jgi:gamma-glutamyltranspeptidase/glutathione hydrolase
MGFAKARTYWHLLIEAKKLAFEDRARFYADMQFMADVPVDELLSEGPRQGRTVGELIDMTRAARRVDTGNPRLDHGDTTFLVVADWQRPAGVAHPVQLHRVRVRARGARELGFGLQNRGGLFNLDPEHPNALEPGKRPFHTIIPAMFGTDGVPTMAFGVMGGSMQPQGHVQIVLNMVDFGMNLQEAGDAPRFRHLGSSQPTGTVMTDGGTVTLESGVPIEVRRELVKRGHRLQEPVGQSFGGYQAVARDPETGVLSGATESRKDGCAAGY